MDLKKKIIAVCTTEAQNNDRQNFINELYNCLDESKYKLMVFNAIVDFEKGEDCESVIFDLINYNLISYLIIDSLHFKNRDIMARIVERAKAHNCPVLLVHTKMDGCIHIDTAYESSYKQVLQYLITEQGVKDFFYIGGIKGEAETELRHRYIRETLEANGLTLPEERVAYGSYIEEGATEIVLQTITEYKLPEVFVCANDVMAMGVYSALKGLGYRIGKDVKVVGFDGLVYTNIIEPNIATVELTARDIAECCVNALMDIERGDGKEYYSVEYRPVLAESCGYSLSPKERVVKYNRSSQLVLEQMRRVERMHYYENRTFDILDRVFNIEEVPNLYSLWVNLVDYGGVICLKSDFANCVLSGNPLMAGSTNDFSDTFYVLLNSSERKAVTDSVKVHLTKYMVPDLEEWVNSDNSGIYILMRLSTKNILSGHYAVKTNNIPETLHRCCRTCRAINIILTEGISRAKLLTNMSGSGINSITGLPNLSRANAWFNNFVESEKGKRSVLMVSLYWLPEYTAMYEKIGIAEAEQDIRFIGEGLKIANPYNSYIAQISTDEFVVVNWVDKIEEVSGVINSGTGIFFGMKNSYEEKRKEIYNNENYIFEVNCGCTVVEDVNVRKEFIPLVKLARAEMFANRLKYNSANEYKPKSAEVKVKEDYSSLKALLANNLFVYNYQPIVDIANEGIYAYEALMRTSGEIKMSPIDIIKTAEAYNRLYEIERATIFNVMGDYAERTEEFKGRKVFINSIPGYFLNEADKVSLREKYEGIFDAFVFEITEGGTASDTEVLERRALNGEALGIPLAIDDYGSGHSNIVNLLRYSPQIIKIDRYLITDVDKDKNKQMFIRGTIDFARTNNIKVLAEGVETKEEFKEVIKLGVDYVQGYYTGKPNREPMDELPGYVLEDIREAKLESDIT